MVPAFLRGIGLVIAPGRRGRWVLLVGLALVVAVMEALGAVLVFSLVSLMTQPDTAEELPLAQPLLALFPDRSDAILAAFAVGVGLFFLVRSAVLVFQAYAQSRVAWSAGSMLSSRLLVGYLSLPYITQLRRNSAEYVRNCYDMVNRVVGQVLFPALMVTSESLLVLSIVGVLLFIAPSETVIGAVVLGPVVYLMLRVIRPRLVRAGKENVDAVADTYQALQQALHGAREVRLHGAKSYFESEYTRNHRRMADTQVMHATLIDAPRIAMETLLVLAIVVFLLLVSMRGGSTAGTLPLLGLFAYAVFRLMPSLHRVMTQLSHIRFGQAALFTVVDDLRLIAAESESSICTEDRLSFEHEITLEDVSFQYENAEIPAIDTVSLSVKRGESVGIVGPTGGGKSTLVDLMIGLLAPTRGRVLVDGADISSCTEQWHACLGVVPQTIYLLDDTIRRNIALGIPEAAVDEVLLERVAHAAQLGDVLAESEEGLNTIIGERGVRLSGGQRQRVAIARALYREPEVLVLDEGTSALDNATEATLMQSLEELRGSITLITVAHRLTTVRRCDRILVVEKGRVVATGTYEELLANNERFRRLEHGQAGPSA